MSWIEQEPVILLICYFKGYLSSSGNCFGDSSCPGLGVSMRVQTVRPPGAVQFMTLMDRKDDRPEIVVCLISEFVLLSNLDVTGQHILRSS
jgi:hypothetical protein